jgi:hypothetical protein
MRDPLIFKSRGLLCAGIPQFAARAVTIRLKAGKSSIQNNTELPVTGGSIPA